MDSKPCMIFDDPTAVQNSLTTKLVTSVHSDYAMAVTMIKNTLHTAYSGASNSQRWLYVMSALREEEQLRTRAAAETQHGCSTVLKRPGGQSTERGLTPTERHRPDRDVRPVRDPVRNATTAALSIISCTTAYCHDRITHRNGVLVPTGESLRHLPTKRFIW